MNTNSTNINIRIDRSIKEEADNLFKDLGMNITTAINLFLKQSIRNQALPFHVTRNIPNKETAEAIKELDNMLKNPQEYESYANVDELKRALLGE